MSTPPPSTLGPTLNKYYNWKLKVTYGGERFTEELDINGKNISIALLTVDIQILTDKELPNFSLRKKVGSTLASIATRDLNEAIEDLSVKAERWIKQRKSEKFSNEQEEYTCIKDFLKGLPELKDRFNRWLNCKPSMLTTQHAIEIKEF